MQIKLKTCDCDIDALLAKIECTIFYITKQKYYSLVYNTSYKFDADLLKQLVRYKNILNKRKYNCTYPCPSIKTRDIISHVNTIAFRDGNCSQCESCFPELNQ